jgi:hypothetical protein
MAAAPSRSRGDYDHLIKLLLIGDSGACLPLPFSPPLPLLLACGARQGLVARNPYHGSRTARRSFLRPPYRSLSYRKKKRSD